MSTAIELQNVSRSVGETHILEEVSLAVPKGSLFGLVGRSGAGKTTTLRVLLGLARPTRGSSSILGVSSRSLHRLGRRVAVSFDRAALEPQLTVTQNLRLYAHHHGCGKVDQTRLLEGLDLAGLRNRRAGKLSQGEQARVSIARALLLRPEVLVLDEPLSHLDPGLAKGVLDLLADEVRDRGMTLLLSSHQLFHLERRADRLALIHRGRLRLQGTLSDLLGDGASRWSVGVDGGRKAQQILRDHPIVRSVEQVDNGESGEGSRDRAEFRLILGEDDPAAINAVLHEAGLRVHLLRPHQQSLDDLFHETVASVEREES